MDTEVQSDSEEEILVYAEFEESVNIGKYRSVHVLGINEKKPIIQMDDTFFTGKFENPIGTYMFFEEDLAPQCSDPLFDKLPEKNLKYVYKTRKYLNMDHAYVTPKEGTEQDLKRQLQQPEDDIEPVHFKSLQEALEKFKNDWNLTNAPNITLKDMASEQNNQHVDVLQESKSDCNLSKSSIFTLNDTDIEKEQISQDVDNKQNSQNL